MFTKDEAFHFVKNFLHVKNPEDRMMTDRRRLLDDIIFGITLYIPFQNVSLLSVDPSERRKPSLEEMKSNFTSGIGGLCFDLNIPTFYLLRALGYDVEMAHSTVTTLTLTPSNLNKHIILYVIGLEQEGDRFLVDGASGHPVFRATSLDFEIESPVFEESFLEYKYVKYEGQLLRMHRKGDMHNQSEGGFWLGDWRRFYYADLEGTKDVSPFECHHSQVYTDPAVSDFHDRLLVITYRGGKAAIVANQKLLDESEISDKGRLSSTALSGDEGILSAIQQICPALPKQLISKALTNWRLVQKSHL